MKIDRLLHKLGLESILRTALAVSSCLPGNVFYVDMDLEKSWGTAGPFINEKLFCVTHDMDKTELDFIIDTSGGIGLLQVVDNDTDETIWQSNITESTIVSQAIGPLRKNREYALRFTGTVPSRGRITVSSRSDAVKEVIHTPHDDPLAQAAQA